MTIHKIRVKIALTTAIAFGLAPPNLALSQPVPNWNAGGEIEIQDSMVVVDNINLVQPLTLNINNKKTLELQGDISLQGLALSGITKTGAGNLILSGNNVNQQKNNFLKQGSIKVVNDNSLGHHWSILNAYKGTLIEYGNGISVDNVIAIDDNHDALDPAEQADNPNLNPNAVTWLIKEGNTATQVGQLRLSANTPLIKTGGGELILNTNAITPNGLFEVHQGSVVVQQNIFGQMTLRNQAKLSGNGAIENLIVNDNAVVAPTGKLTIHNSIKFSNNSTLQIRAWADGNNDSIHSLQTADLNGRVLVMPQGIADDWVGDNYEYVILQADQDPNINPNGGLNNSRFNGAESSVPYLEPKLKYTTNQVLLNLKPVRFNQVNRSRLGGSKGNSENGNNHTNNHLWVSNTKTMLIEDSRFIRKFALQTKPKNTKLWFKTFYSDAGIGLKINQHHKNFNLNTVDHINRQIGGFFVGVNLLDRVSSYNKAYNIFKNSDDKNHRIHKNHKYNQANFKVNLIAGYTNSHMRGYGSVADPKSDINSYHIGITNSYNNNNYGIKLGLSHSYHKIKYHRQSSALTSKQSYAWGHNVSSRTSAKTNQIFIKTSLNLNEYITPYIDLAYIRYSDKGFKEIGGVLAVNTKRQKIQQTVASLGLDMNIPVNDTAKVNIGLAYSHTFGKINPSSKQYYRYDVLKTGMTAKPTLQKRNNLDFRLGAEGNISDISNGLFGSALKNTWLGVEYTGRYAKKYADHGVRVGMRAVF